MSEITETSAKRPPPGEAPRDRLRAFGVVRQWLGMSGGESGTRARWTFLYSLAIAAATVGVVNAINVITITHEDAGAGFAAPMIWEGSSWITFLLFFWIPWLGWRFAPPLGHPRWKLLIHIPTAIAFSLAHVTGFVLIRKLAYWLAGAPMCLWLGFGVGLKGFGIWLGLAFGLTVAAITLTTRFVILSRKAPRGGAAP